MYNRASAFKNHRLYPEFKKVSDRLRAHQFVCWVAGGAVRDLLLQREVSDLDLVTDASTEVLKALFPEAVLVGEAFGVLKIPVQGGEFLDLATFREESDYKDGRRPSQVKSSTPVQDSVRRDFTVNAFFWDDESQVVRDYQGGLSDLQQKILICVGQPEVRFAEDYLRIVRLLRFSLQLGFKMESETLKAAKISIVNISRISGERIWAEFKKIEKSKNWYQPESADFFKSILTVVLGDESVKASDLSKLNGLSIEVFFNLLNSEVDYSIVLKSRFKISNVELELYQKTRLLLHSLEKWSLEELSLELEKSEILFLQYKYLVKIGLVKSEQLEKVERLLAEHREPLITASELVSLIPPRQISSEIRLIRLGQLGKNFRSKEDVFCYLKKKYA